MNLVANKAIEYFEIFERSNIFNLKLLSEGQFGTSFDKYELYYLKSDQKIRCFIYQDMNNGKVPVVYNYISGISSAKRFVLNASVDLILEDPDVSNEIKTFIVFNIDMFSGS